MLFAITLCGFVAIVIAHELGHYFAMRRHGIPVAEIGLGIPLPKVPHIRLCIRRGKVPLYFCLHLLVIGAYVKPTLRGVVYLKRLGYVDYAEVYGAGILANYAGTAVLVAVLALLKGSWSFAIPFVVTGCIFWLRRPLSAYLLPLTSLFALAFTAFGLYLVPLRQVGPSEIIVMAHAPSWEDAVIRVAIFSLSLGMLNSLPFPLLDVGNIIAKLAERYTPKIVTPFRILGVLAVLSLIAYGFIGDIAKYFF